MQWLTPTYWVLYGLVTTQYGDYKDHFVLDETGQRMSVVQYVRERFGFRHSVIGWCAPVCCALQIACSNTAGMPAFGCTIP